ncbi:MAG: hypothetical protein U5J83_14090 [Bryobacterales bacterium]|nr:hypothetical protein [Bryobacterales bacterium]
MSAQYLAKTAARRRFSGGDPTKATPPEGLQRIQAMFPGEEIFYVGDTVDDARSARSAGVRFIGVASALNPRAAVLGELLAAEGAIAVIDNINEMEPVVYA